MLLLNGGLNKFNVNVFIINKDFKQKHFAFLAKCFCLLTPLTFFEEGFKNY
jgi:hypothetical protein